jgi:serine/threonine protein kinase
MFMLIFIQLFKDRFEISDRVLGQGAYGAVYLAQESSTSRQMACKIIDLDVAADRLTERSLSSAKGEDWNRRLRRVAHGRELVMREIKILSKLSHVCIMIPRYLSHTDASQPHIINLKKAFISSNAL